MQPEIVAAFIGVVGTILGSVISFQLGRRQSVDKNLRIRRTEVALAIYEKTRGISTYLDMIAVKLEHGDGGIVEDYRILMPKVDELNEYWASNEPWLTEKEARIVANCIAVVRSGIGEIYSVTDPDEERRAVRGVAQEVRTQFGDLTAEVRNVIGVAERPWWRRVFGG